jgi:hypothetical protein
MNRFTSLAAAVSLGSLSLLLVAGCSVSSSTDASTARASDELRTDDSLVSGDTSWETTFQVPAMGSSPANELRLRVVLHPAAGAPSSMNAYLATIDGGEGGFPTRYECRTDISFPTGTADVSLSNTTSGASVYQATRNLSAATSFESDTTGPDVQCHPHEYPSFSQNAVLAVDADGSIPLPSGGAISFVNGIGFGGAVDAQNQDANYRLTDVKTRIPSGQYEVWVQIHDAQGVALGVPTLALFRRL